VHGRRVGLDSLEGLLECLSALVELTYKTREETMGGFDSASAA
jgi:hypothetical protein